MNEKLAAKEEIELIDLLRIVWKWKYFIVGVTLAFAIITAIVNFNMTKIYRVSMIITPGMINNNYIKGEHLGSIDNIEKTISAGMYNSELVKFVKLNYPNKQIVKPRFKLLFEQNSQILTVTYETSDQELGILLLNELYNLIKQANLENINFYKDEYKIKIATMHIEIDHMKNEKKFYELEIRNIEKQILDAKLNLKVIRNKSKNLLNKKINLSTKSNDVLKKILFNDVTQQNFFLQKVYLEQIERFQFQLEKAQKNIDKLKTSTIKKNEEIQLIELVMRNIKNIQKIYAPEKNNIKIKPTIKLNVIIAAIIGFCIMLFLSFLLEYILQYSKDDKKMINR